MNTNIEKWLNDFLSSAAKDFIAKITSGERGQIPIENWEAETIRRGVIASAVEFKNGSLQLPDRQPWSVFTFNREYITHVATYLELVQKYGAEHVKVEQSYMDILVDKHSERIAIEIKKSETDGERLVANLSKILPTPNLEAPDRGNDPLRKAKALLELKAHQFWVITPTKRWHFQVEYPESGGLMLRSIEE